MIVVRIRHCTGVMKKAMIHGPTSVVMSERGNSSNNASRNDGKAPRDALAHMLAITFVDPWVSSAADNIEGSSI
jgi:hypothetical protein